MFESKSESCVGIVPQFATAILATGQPRLGAAVKLLKKAKYNNRLSGFRG